MNSGRDMLDTSLTACDPKSTLWALLLCSAHALSTGVDGHRFSGDNRRIQWRGMADMTASPSNFVNRLFFGYQNSAALKAALELDVFTAIGEGAIDAAAIAAQCN